MSEAATPGLLVRLRGHLSLSRAQTIFGLFAALLSIGGTVYGYLRVTSPPDTGELVTLVRDRADKPIADAIVEVLTPKDVLVTSFTATEPTGGRRTVKEGTYKLRVTHPKYASDTRTVQVLAGQTSEVRFRLAPPAAARPAPASGAAGGSSPVNEATRAVNEGVESLKKIFR
jgi:hypothetical protein